MRKKVTILGSTGSIGTSTLKVLDFLKDEFQVYGLACSTNLGLLEKQIDCYKPSVVAVESARVLRSEKYKALKKKYQSIEFLESEEGVIELAGRNVDLLVSAIVGSAGLKPSLAALDATKRIAIANKETLVMAGEIFMNIVVEKGIELIPVDSEHSALFMLLAGHSKREVERLIITASGGSLRNIPIDKLDNVTPKMALAHPTWNMGSKITIDSATLFNKGLEVIEAHYLFDFDYDRISVVIHPESIIHSLVETIDGSVYAHLGVADMTLPIINSFTYPQKVKNCFGRLNFEEIGQLTFNAYDNQRFPALDLCYEAGKTGGTMTTVLNAANEKAVDAFLKQKISFTEIVKVVEHCMHKHITITNPGLADILTADAWAREISDNYISKTGD